MGRLTIGALVLTGLGGLVAWLVVAARTGGDQLIDGLIAENTANRRAHCQDMGVADWRKIGVAGARNWQTVVTAQRASARRTVSTAVVAEGRPRRGMGGRAGAGTPVRQPDSIN